MANASCSSLVKIDIFAKPRIWAEVLGGSVHDTANVLRELIAQIFTYSFSSICRIPTAQASHVKEWRILSQSFDIVLAHTYSFTLRNTHLHSKLVFVKA